MQHAVQLMEGISNAVVDGEGRGSDAVDNNEVTHLRDDGVLTLALLALGGYNLVLPAL